MDKVPVFTMDHFDYLDDVSEMIDRYAGYLPKMKKAEKQRCLTIIRQLVALYEGHVGRKVFKKF